MNRFFQIFRIKDLRIKVFKIAFLLLVFRLMANIPIPGVDPVKLQEFFSANQLFGLFNVFAGGTLSQLSIIMLGLAPYITAVIILQLLTIIFPKLKEIYYEQGAQGRAKFNRYSRYLTVPLAFMQAYGFLNLLVAQGVIDKPSFLPLIVNILVITAGSMILVWIGELITEYRLGNGVSLLICAGIVARFPAAVRQSILNYDPSMIPTYFIFLLMALVVTAGVVFVTEGERRIPVSFAKRVRGTRLYGGVQTFLPIRVNQAGVIPIIFAISVLLFPQFIAQVSALFSKDFSVKLNQLVNNFYSNLWIYSLIYFALVVVFTYFYTAVTFDPEEVSKNLQKSGGFILGIRPGASTTEFIKKIVNRITLFGAIFLGIVAILPHLVRVFTGITGLTIGGTALLIVVAVSLEIMKQVDSQLMIREYEGIL